jgi:hypothetical protein
MPSDQIITVDFIDFLAQELSVRIVGRNVYMWGERSDIPE